MQCKGRGGGRGWGRGPGWGRAGTGWLCSRPFRTPFSWPCLTFPHSALSLSPLLPSSGNSEDSVVPRRLWGCTFPHFLYTSQGFPKQVPCPASLPWGGELPRRYTLLQILFLSFTCKNMYLVFRSIHFFPQCFCVI